MFCLTVTVHDSNYLRRSSKHLQFNTKFSLQYTSIPPDQNTGILSVPIGIRGRLIDVDGSYQDTSVRQIALEPSPSQDNGHALIEVPSIQDIKDIYHSSNY